MVAASNSADGSGRPDNETILIVDDDEDCRFIYSIALKNAGYRVLVAADGDEGVCMAQTHAPSLVLMDIGMPKVDGMDALKALRTDERTRHIPTLALTARVSLHQRSELLAAGFDDVLLKPILPKNVVVAVGEIVRTRH